MWPQYQMARTSNLSLTLEFSSIYPTLATQIYLYNYASRQQLYEQYSIDYEFEPGNYWFII
jgi:hypothetical protein